MVQLFNIRSLLKLSKIIALVVIFSMSIVVPELSAKTWKAEGLSKEEREAKIQELYASKPKITVSKEASKILYKELTYFGGGEARREKAVRELNRLIAAGSDYYKAKRGIRWGDSNAEDYFQDVLDALDDFVEDGIWSQKEMNIVLDEVNRIHKEVLSRVEEASKYERNQRVAERVQEEAADERVDTKEYLANVRGALACPDSNTLRAKYTAGCWSCLVLERLISAFLHAANKGLPIVQKAGLTLLWIGFAIWVVMWALKNVSSFTEIQIGNILNDLIKGLFKIAIAYWFICNSTTAISQYFINPIMSIGGIIGQQFWPPEMEPFTQNWEDEHISDEDYEDLKVKLDANTTPGGSKNNDTQQNVVNGEAQNDGEQVQEQVSQNPEPVEPDEHEELVQMFQKALIGVLQQFLSEITNSCGGPCGRSCRHTNCGNSGHQSYVKKLWARGGGGSILAAYCQISITAALEEINERVGGNITNYQKGTGYCLNGIAKGAEYPNAAFIGEKGGDIVLQDALQYANVGDTVFIRMKGSDAVKTGSGSGYHATTYIGGGRLLSFNGDGYYESPNISTRKPSVGKIVRFSEIVRARLKQNPNVQIDKKALAQLADAANMNVSLINYKGGAYPDMAPPIDFSELVVDIPHVNYTGPTNIMSQSVMNSLLGATRAITNTTAEMMVLGNAVTCYASDENGGSWKVFGVHIVNIFMWISGAIIWSLGFMLTLAIAYYLLDISFKIGFAVLSIPVLMGLWPFGFTQGKIYIALSIIAKASATFAFLALTTAFGMAMFSEAIGSIEILYQAYDSLTESATGENGDALKDYIADQVMPFSSTFLLACFTMLYFYKLVEQTISDLVNKFFPDKAFGDSSPMHTAATMMTSWAKNLATKATGLDLAKDIVANQAGNLVKGGLKATGRVATALPKAAIAGGTTAAYKGIKRAVRSGSIKRGAQAWAHEMGKTDVGKVVSGAVRVGSKVVSKGKQLKRDHGGVLKGAYIEAKQATKNAIKNTGKAIKQAPKAIGKAINNKLSQVTTKVYNGAKKGWRAVTAPFRAQTYRNIARVFKVRLGKRKRYKKSI